MKKLITAQHALELYAANPHLVSGFGQSFAKYCHAVPLHQSNPRLATFRYTFLPQHKNIQETVHGGALATMIDVITTVGILRMTPHRTISISLNTQFLNVIKVGQEVRIETEVSKIGKSIVFTDCRIFTIGEKEKLACKGTHIKSILQDKWNFMEEF